MGSLSTVNAVLAGFFACAAIHYAFHWGRSRHERVLLVFSIQCAFDAAFSLAISAFFRATTIPDAQATLDTFVTIGVLIHVLLLQFYAELGGRRDRFFRALVAGALVFLALLNQWAPLRGTIVELRTMQLPGGGTGLLPIRTPPGASLAALYLLVLVIQMYGLFVVRALWKRDRAGAIFIALGTAAYLAGATLGCLVDFAHVRAPYAGALPHALFVVFVALHLSREYSARGARLAATLTELHGHRERLEELVATRTCELRAAKDEAERASQAKSRFLAHMSHEIRSPLHVILLNAEILESSRSLSADELKSVGTILKSGQHLAAIINKVLDMSAIEAGRMNFVAHPFDLGATLGEVEQMFDAQATSNGTELSIEPSLALPRSLVGDGGKVKQILINLVSNAIKFTGKGAIRVTATCTVVAEAAALVEIVVADTGPGIAEENLARMFQPFEQLDGRAKAGGTGLGLAISLAYARGMGGDISVESAPGLGSRFKLTFLAERAGPEQASASSEPPVSFASIAPARSKVLIVDDMEMIREVVAVLLARHAFETRTAADGPAALSLHSEWRPDIVLMDLRLPGMNGLEVIRRLRAAGSTAAIGALTAGAFGDDEREARRAGADFFIRKPFSERDLVDSLAVALASRGGGNGGRGGGRREAGGAERSSVGLE